MSAAGRIKLVAASAEDAEAIASLRNAISDDLTFKHGKGPWTAHCTTAGVLFDLRNAKLFVALRRDEVIATLKLATKKPWAIDRSYFSAIEKPIYLTSLAVAPEHQGRGLGRACLEQAASIAKRLKAEAIFLDAFDHPTAGAGDFYLKCGYREAGRAVYREVPLRYYEQLL